MLAKLYSYYFTNLFRRNWIRIIIFSLVAIVGAWVIAPLGSFHMFKRGAKAKYGTDDKSTYRELVKSVLNDPATRINMEGALAQKQAAREAWETARQSGDENAINVAEEVYSKWVQSEAIVNSYFFPLLPPIQEAEYNYLSLGVEYPGGTSSGLQKWRMINKLSFWALTSGLLFSYLTIHLADFLFLTPKKSGEEAIVLNFTPGVKRSDLLISKILVFLTYYGLIGLVTFVLPGLVYYLWAGSSVATNLVLLFLYTVLATPLLALGLIILPFLLISNWSSVLGSLFSYTIYLLPFSFYLLALFSPWADVIKGWFFNHLIFVPLALGVGAVSFTLYYYQCQSEDLKGY